MNKFIVWPYKMGSQSAKYIAHGLNTKRVYPNGRYRPRENHIIINWGNSNFSNWFQHHNSDWQVLNHPNSIKKATNKLSSFQTLKFANINIPEFTTVITEAQEWNSLTVCRQTLTGSQGHGIVLASTPSDIIPCPLYTKHLHHKYEFRVHVMGGEVIDYVQKKKIDGYPDANTHIRNHGRGWIFARQDIPILDCVKQEAIKAVQALGLDFGAVDIAYRERENKAFVLEINTACGLDEEGTTLQRYVESFKRIYNV